MNTETLAREGLQPGATQTVQGFPDEFHPGTLEALLGTVPPFSSRT